MKLLAFIHAHLGDARGLFRRAMFFTFLEGLVTAGPVIAVALGLMRLAQGPADALALLPYAVAVVAAVALRILLIRLAWSSGFRAGNVATEAIRNRLVGHMRAVPSARSDAGVPRVWPPSSPRTGAGSTKPRPSR